ncbi:MAG TPA: hypothetical protein VMX94_00315 [Armatimonadota bacterium]|nr:hypothetical protein [Armatimonadota bacterium]
MNPFRPSALLALLAILISTHAQAAPKSKLGVNYLVGDDGITFRALVETGNLPIFRIGIDRIQDLIPYYKQHNPNGIVAVGMVSKSLDYTKDPDVLGIALYKVGRPETSKWSDLSDLADWYVGYVNRYAAE